MDQWVPGHTYPDFEAFRDSDAFDGISAGGQQSMLVVEQSVVPQTRQVYFATHDFFATIGVVGRLRSGDTTAAATARLNALGCQCPRELSRGEAIPVALTNVNVAAVPELVRARTGQFATLLSIAVGLLLLVGCLTVGMLLLLRTEDRREELAVRLALGATRSRLAASIAAEAAALVALGAVLEAVTTRVAGMANEGRSLDERGSGSLTRGGLLHAHADHHDRGGAERRQGTEDRSEHCEHFFSL